MVNCPVLPTVPWVWDPYSELYRTTFTAAKLSFERRTNDGLICPPQRTLRVFATHQCSVNKSFVSSEVHATASSGSFRGRKAFYLPSFLLKEGGVNF